MIGYAPEAGRVLIVDDETAVVEDLARVCRKEGFEVTARTTAQGALEAMENNRYDIVLSDLRIANADGMAVLRRTGELDPDTAVIITGTASLDSAIDAMKAGAFAYISRPFHQEPVCEIVRNALEMVNLKRENRQLKEQLTISRGKYAITTQDEIMQRLPTLVEREADYIRHVLEQSGWNRTRAAKILGIDRVSLWRKLKKYGMEEESQVDDNKSRV